MSDQLSCIPVPPISTIGGHVHFSLTQEQRMIQDLARQFADREIIPVAAKSGLDKSSPLRVHRQALELGLLNLAVPEEFGGAGLGAFEVALVAEQFCRGCLAIGAALCINALALEPILLAGNESQKGAYFSRLCVGEIARLSLADPSAGTDVCAVCTVA